MKNRPPWKNSAMKELPAQSAEVLQRESAIVQLDAHPAIRRREADAGNRLKEQTKQFINPFFSLLHIKRG